MKLKIILILITVALSTLFTACSNRPPEEIGNCVNIFLFVNYDYIKRG